MTSLTCLFLDKSVSMLECVAVTSSHQMAVVLRCPVVVCSILWLNYISTAVQVGSKCDHKNPINIFKTEVWRQLKTSSPHLVVRGDPLPVLEVAAICAGCSWTCSRSHEGIWRRNQKDVLSTEGITVQQRQQCFSTSQSTDSRTNSITEKSQSHVRFEWKCGFI